MDLRSYVFWLFLVGLLITLWSVRAVFRKPKLIPGEEILWEVRPVSVEVFFRGTERMFRPVLRMTGRRLLLGQMPLFGKTPNVRYAIYREGSATSENASPFKTGFVSLFLRPDQMEWTSDRLEIRPTGQGGLSGIPDRIVIVFAEETERVREALKQWT